MITLNLTIKEIEQLWFIVGDAIDKDSEFFQKMGYGKYNDEAGWLKNAKNVHAKVNSIMDELITFAEGYK